MIIKELMNLHTKKPNNKLTFVLSVILGILIILLISGFYFFDKTEINKSYFGVSYLSIRSSNTKPYKILSCSLTLPFTCSVGTVFENSDKLMGPPDIGKKKGMTSLEKCGDFPSDNELKIPRGHWNVVDGPEWAFDCKHIAYSVYNTGTVAISDDGGGVGVRGSAEEGIFLYTVDTKTVEKISIPKTYLALAFEFWLKNNVLNFTAITKDNPNRHIYRFDITTSKITSQ